MVEAARGRVAGKVALITGAAGGIGRATVRRLVEEGARIAAVDLPERLGELESLQDEVGGDAVLPLAADVTDQQSLDRAAAEAPESFGRIDVLFANAGVLLPEAPAEELDEVTWQKVIDIDLTGVWKTAKAVFPHLKRNPDGSSVDRKSVV